MLKIKIEKMIGTKKNSANKEIDREKNSVKNRDREKDRVKKSARDNEKNPET